MSRRKHCKGLVYARVTGRVLPQAAMAMELILADLYLYLNVPYGRLTRSVYVASRLEPCRARFAGEPFLGLRLAVEADNMLLLAAKDVYGQETPHAPQLDRFGVERNLIGGAPHS